MNSPVASATLWITFLEAVFKEYSPLPNNCFLYLSDKFLANDRNVYLLTYFLRLSSIEYLESHFYILIRYVRLILSSISNGLQL